MYDIETLSVHRVSNKDHFYGKFMQKNVHQKLVPDLFLILVNNPKQSLHARNLLKLRYFERLSKSLKTLFFLLNPVAFNGQLSKTKEAWY